MHFQTISVSLIKDSILKHDQKENSDRKTLDSVGNQKTQPESTIKSTKNYGYIDPLVVEKLRSIMEKNESIKALNEIRVHNGQVCCASPN